MHVEINNIIGQNQHRFKNKNSCLTNLLKKNVDMTSRIDKGKPIDRMFL